MMHRPVNVKLMLCKIPEEQRPQTPGCRKYKI